VKKAPLKFNRTLLISYLHPYDHQIKLSFLTESKNVLNLGGEKVKILLGTP